MDMVDKERMSDCECIKGDKKCRYLHRQFVYMCSSKDELACGCCREYIERD